MPTDPKQYIGRKLPAFPIDLDRDKASVLVLPIVVGTDVIGYLPAAATDNGDGTALLKVDTELVLNGNVIVSNIKVGSVDQTDTTLKYLKTLSDGTLVVSIPGGAVAANFNVEKWGGTAQTGANLTPLFQNLDVALSTKAKEATLLLVLAELTSILNKIDLIVDGETPSGTINGVNKTFTTAKSWKPTTTHLYLNGVRQKEGPGNDYVEEIDNVTLTLTVAPIGGDVLIVDYREL